MYSHMKYNKKKSIQNDKCRTFLEAVVLSCDVQSFTARNTSLSESESEIRSHYWLFVKQWVVKFPLILISTGHD